MAALELRELRKSFGRTEVIHGIDLAIDDGAFVVLVGPSGCGKSTLLRMIAGLEDISDGELTIGGRRVNDLPPAGRGVAMVFQSYALYPHMTVFQNMAFGLEMRKLGRAEIDRQVRQAAERLELTPLLGRLPRQLSGGQRQRVAIGRAIVREPQVFLFDEPLSNLDAALRVQMRLEIAKLQRSLGATTVYVTHDQVEAMTLADRIVVLNRGRVEQIGSPLDLYHRPANLFVAGFIGSPRMNFLAATVSGMTETAATVELAAGTRLTTPARPGGAALGGAVTVGVRPEHLQPASDDAGATLQGKVEVIEQLGEFHHLYLRLPDRTVLTVRGDGDGTARVGDTVTVALDPGCCHLFDDEGRALQPENGPAGRNGAARRQL